MAGWNSFDQATKRQVGLAAVAGVSFIVAAVLLYSPSLRTDSTPERRAAALFGSGDPDAHLPPSDAAPGTAGEGVAGRLYQASTPLQEEPELQMFLKLLNSPDPKAARAVERFRGELRKEPSLRKAIEEFLGTPPERRDVAEFVKKLGAMPEFQKLVARFRSDPGAGSTLFLGAGDASSEGESRGIGAPRAGPSGVPPSFDQARAYALGSASTQASASKTRGALGPPARGTFGGQRGGGGAVQESSAGTTEDGAGSGASQTGGGPEKGGENAHGGAGKDAHEVGKLDKGWLTAEREEDDGGWSVSDLLAKTDAATRRDLAGVVGVAEDLWGGCFVADRYQECRQACSQTTDCAAPTMWESCLSGNTRTTLECIGLCAAKAGCQVPPAVLASGTTADSGTGTTTSDTGAGTATTATGMGTTATTGTGTTATTGAGTTTTAGTGTTTTNTAAAGQVPDPDQPACAPTCTWEQAMQATVDYFGEQTTRQLAINTLAACHELRCLVALGRATAPTYQLAVQATLDYFDGKISKADAVDILKACRDPKCTAALAQMNRPR